MFSKFKAAIVRIFFGHYKKSNPHLNAPERLNDEQKTELYIKNQPKQK